MPSLFIATQPKPFPAAERAGGSKPPCRLSAEQAGTPSGNAGMDTRREHVTEAMGSACPEAATEASRSREEWCPRCGCPRERCWEDRADGAGTRLVLHPHRGPGLLAATSAHWPILPWVVWLGATQALGKRVRFCAPLPAGSGCRQQLPSAFWRQPIFPSAVTGFRAAAQHRHLVLSTRTEFLSHISVLPTCLCSPVASMSQSLPRI